MGWGIGFQRNGCGACGGAALPGKHMAEKALTLKPSAVRIPTPDDALRKSAEREAAAMRQYSQPISPLALAIDKTERLSPSAHWQWRSVFVSYILACI